MHKVVKTLFSKNTQNTLQGNNFTWFVHEGPHKIGLWM